MSHHNFYTAKFIWFFFLSFTKIHQMFQFFLFSNEDITLLTSQYFNIGSTLLQRCDPTLKMKQNPTSVFQRCTSLIQRRSLTFKQLWRNNAKRWNNVETTLHNVETRLYQHCFNVASALLKLYRNQSGYWIWIYK